MKTEEKMSVKKCAPAARADEGFTIGDVSFTVFGIRISVEQLNIRKVGRPDNTRPEVKECSSRQRTSQRRK